MKIEYVYCGGCGKTTRHTQRQPKDLWICSHCRRTKFVSGQYAPVGEKRDDDDKESKA